MIAEKQIIKLDKEEISKAIEDGDNASGQRWLAIRPNGDSQIHWADRNRQWDPWADDAYRIGVPALNPDGSGEESEDAKALLQTLGLQEQAETLIETEDLGGWAEAAERLAPDDWAEERANSLEWLADAFLSACNGEGSELNDLAPWGYTYESEYGPQTEIEPPFEFEWK